MGIVRNYGEDDIMDIRYATLSFLMIGVCACAPLLYADFDALPEVDMTNQAINLPGPPTGDRMLVGRWVELSDPTSTDDQVLSIYRNPGIDPQDVHGEVTFDPIGPNDEGSLFFSWRGDIIEYLPQRSSAPVVAVMLRDLAGSHQPGAASKLTVRFGPDEISVVPSPGQIVPIGQQVRGNHTVILRIDPGPRTYELFIAGDQVSPGGSVSHTGSLAAGATVDPNSVGITITFAQDPGPGLTTYVVSTIEISERRP